MDGYFADGPRRSYVQFFFHNQLSLLYRSTFYSSYTLLVHLKTGLYYSITRNLPTADSFTQ